MTIELPHDDLQGFLDEARERAGHLDIQLRLDRRQHRPMPLLRGVASGRRWLRMGASQPRRIGAYRGLPPAARPGAWKRFPMVSDDTAETALRGSPMKQPPRAAVAALTVLTALGFVGLLVALTLLQVHYNAIGITLMGLVFLGGVGGLLWASWVAVNEIVLPWWWNRRDF